MKAVSIVCWRDLEDGHLYYSGDEFPHDGREIPEERIAALSGTQNKAGFALIRIAEAPNRGIATETPEKPKKAAQKRKKTT